MTYCLFPWCMCCYFSACLFLSSIILFFLILEHHITLEIYTIRVLFNILMNKPKCKVESLGKHFKFLSLKLIPNSPPPRRFLYYVNIYSQFSTPSYRLRTVEIWVQSSSLLNNFDYLWDSNSCRQMFLIITFYSILKCLSPIRRESS